MKITNFFHHPKSAEDIAGAIVDMIAESSFDKFSQAQFRSNIEFQTMELEEQDRIFNELVATGICLVYLTLERGEMENIHEKSQMCFRQIKNSLVGSYVNKLKNYGVEKNYTDLWHQLIAMRCQEYREDYKKHKKIFSNSKINHWVRICTIGGSTHICRGEHEKIEQIITDIAQWCGNLFINGMRIVAKEVRATDSQTGKEVKISLRDDGTIDLR